MKDITGQISVIVSVLVTLVINGLANALPLAGISVKQASVPAVVIPTWITLGLVTLTLVAAFIVIKTGQTKTAQR